MILKMKKKLYKTNKLGYINIFHTKGDWFNERDGVSNHQTHECLLR